jgi:hypothetical protein
VLMISSLLVVFMISGWYFINRFYLQMESSARQIRTVYQLDQQLREEFDKALWVNEINSGITLQLHQHEVSYEFFQMYILRKQNALVDTIFFEVEDYRIDYIKVINGQELITALRLYNKQAKNKQLHYHKKYDAQTLLNFKLRMEE